MYQGSFRSLPNASPADVALVDANGDQLSGFDGSRPATSVITSVPSSVTSVTLAAADPTRRRVVIYNNSTKILYVAFAASATAVLFTVQLAAKASYDGLLNDYTGVISGIWQAVNGNAVVTTIAT